MLYKSASKKKSLHVVFCSLELEVGLFVEPLGLLVPLVSLEVDTLRLGLETVEHANRDIEIGDLFALEAAEVGEQDAGNAAMTDEETVVLHALEFDDDRAKTVDDVEIALAAGTRVAVVQLVLLA